MLFCANNFHSLCCQNMVRMVFYLYHSFNVLRIMFCFNNTVAWNRYQKHHMLQAGVRAYNDAQNTAILWKYIYCIFNFLLTLSLSNANGFCLLAWTTNTSYGKKTNPWVYFHIDLWIGMLITCALWWHTA